MLLMNMERSPAEGLHDIMNHFFKQYSVDEINTGGEGRENMIVFMDALIHDDDLSEVALREMHAAFNDIKDLKLSDRVTYQMIITKILIDRSIDRR